MSTGDTTINALLSSSCFAPVDSTSTSACEVYTTSASTNSCSLTSTMNPITTIAPVDIQGAIHLRMKMLDFFLLPVSKPLSRVYESLTLVNTPSVMTYCIDVLGYSNGRYDSEFNHFEQKLLDDHFDPLQADVDMLYKLLQRVCGLALQEDVKWITPDNTIEYNIFNIKKLRDDYINSDIGSITLQKTESIISLVKSSFSIIFSEVDLLKGQPIIDENEIILNFDLLKKSMASTSSKEYSSTSSKKHSRSPWRQMLPLPANHTKLQSEINSNYLAACIAGLSHILPPLEKQDYGVSLGDESTTSKNSKRKTVWFHHPNGDVNIPEICYFSVESFCRYESSGCDRLHSTQHFHWQISEQGDIWYNLTLPHIKCLELSYCKPEEEAVSLERLNPLNLDRSSGDLLLRLMGHAEWQADFNTMTISCLSQWKVLKLRRLCTQNIYNQDIDGNKFSWYFKNENKKWIEYGNVSSTCLLSSISSKDIEKEFKENPEKTLSFNILNFSYSLDFVSMTQTNTIPYLAREIRRRPKPHLSENLPSTWEPMKSGERVRLVNLQPSSSEYQTVMNMFPGYYNITEIQRIQNPYHCRAFENKVQEMTAVYNNDSSKADVRQLFHGTKSSAIKGICSENFDWRLHGTNSGNLYGKGTYFSPVANHSYRYCKPDPLSGSKYMFIARVAVGCMIVGNSSMSRPPINPTTSMPYDTTVNNVSRPSIIVKYDKQEYYPEYIVTFSDPNMDNFGSRRQFVGRNFTVSPPNMTTLVPSLVSSRIMVANK